MSITALKRNWQRNPDQQPLPHFIFAQRLRAECGVSEQQRDFEQWLGQVEARAGESGWPLLAMLLSDAALFAFEEGVSAQDFALQLQARAA